MLVSCLADARQREAGPCRQRLRFKVECIMFACISATSTSTRCVEKGSHFFCNANAVIPSFPNFMTNVFNSLQRTSLTCIEEPPNSRKPAFPPTKVSFSVIGDDRYAPMGTRTGRRACPKYTPKSLVFATMLVRIILSGPGDCISLCL